MSFQMLGGDTTDINAVVNQMNQNIAQLKVDEQTKIIKDDEGTRVVILDKDGLRTTAPGSGIDVFTAGNDDLTFNSGQNVFKIVTSGTLTITAAAGGGAAGAVDIDPGFTPLVIASCKSPNFGSNYAMLPYIESPSSATSYVLTTMYINPTNITFNIDIGAAATGHSGNWTIKYYILQETAN